VGVVPERAEVGGYPGAEAAKESCGKVGFAVALEWSKMDPLKKKLFLWGVLLAWTPWLPSIIGLGNALRVISTEKATGLAAITGALAETFVFVGLLATVVFEVAAIILLLRAFERGHWVRSVFSAFSICLGGLMLLLLSLFLWLNWSQTHHAT
jgi:hypothetical protein